MQTMFKFLALHCRVHGAQDFGVEFGILRVRAHHRRRGDCALKSVGRLDGARDKFWLEHPIEVFEGEDENLRIVGCVREALGAFRLQTARRFAVDSSCRLPTYVKRLHAKYECRFVELGEIGFKSGRLAAIQKLEDRHHDAWRDAFDLEL